MRSQDPNVVDESGRKCCANVWRYEMVLIIKYKFHIVVVVVVLNFVCLFSSL